MEIGDKVRVNAPHLIAFHNKTGRIAEKSTYYDWIVRFDIASTVNDAAFQERELVVVRSKVRIGDRVRLTPKSKEVVGVIEQVTTSGDVVVIDGCGYDIKDYDVEILAPEFQTNDIYIDAEGKVWAVTGHPANGVLTSVYASLNFPDDNNRVMWNDARVVYPLTLLVRDGKKV